jgi:hypothetical protein
LSSIRRGAIDLPRLGTVITLGLGQLEFACYFERLDAAVCDFLVDVEPMRAELHGDSLSLIGGHDHRVLAA